MRVRREFGPGLPELVPAWAAALVLVALVGVGLLAVFTLGGTEGGREDLVHRGAPAFNLLYDDDLVRVAERQGDELARLEGGGASVTVRPVPDSDLPFGALPVYAEQRIAALRGELSRLRLRFEGKARIWGHPGYRLDYRSGPITGTDVLLFPDDTGLRGGALVSFRREGRGRPRAVEEVRRVLRSFQFGADRR